MQKSSQFPPRIAVRGDNVISCQGIICVNRRNPRLHFLAPPALAYLRGENAPRTGGAAPRPGPGSGSPSQNIAMGPRPQRRIPRRGPLPKRDKSRLGRDPVGQGTFAGLEEAVQASGVACGLLPCSGCVGRSALAGNKRRFVVTPQGVLFKTCSCEHTTNDGETGPRRKRTGWIQGCPSK